CWLSSRSAFALEDEAMAQIRAAGFYPLRIDVPPESNEDHWHDFDAMIFVLEGVNVITVAATGETISCGPGSRADFPRGAIHRENRKGYRGLFGFSVDPATLDAPLNMPRRPGSAERDASSARLPVAPNNPRCESRGHSFEIASCGSLGKLRSKVS